MRSFLYRHNEVSIWLTALLLLFFAVDPSRDQTSLCLFHWLGWQHCPGCGLGKSMHAAMHGAFRQSWHYHYFGIPAVLIIGARIISLMITHKISLHEQLPDGPAGPAT
ncbi:DUF2752 domain-containing protein [Flavihumibacter petaseus]|uniref:DUF2752 domain-containing protein n=1 Tax=Flavihumibacter petaseus TaxID=549295 RepID=UPI0009080EBC|nr:DUF2752 domain-containing protein [Flavihumibacter petaseus]